MEHNLNELVAAKNELVLNGKMIEATQKYFALNAKSVDFDGSRTRNQAEMITKMENFLGAIAKVNGITLNHTATTGNVSFAEFTFDFDMVDGSKILWHEILRSVWEDGKIIEEQYFKG
jgi:hypothetical protein